LEFNPEHYSILLELLSDQRYNVILFNQRRPVITNLSSLKIIRKTGCMVYQLGQTNITDNQSLSSLWSNNIFEKIFSVEGNSFWPCIKNDFIRIIENRYRELIQKITLTESLLNGTKIDLILDWAHTATEEKILSALANVIPFKNKIAVWGDTTKNYVMEHGGTNDNVISVGSPKHDKFFQHYQKKASAVLIVVSELYHSNFDGTNIRAIEELDEYVKQLFILIKKLSKKEIILKLRPGQSSYEIQSTVSKLGYKIPIYKTQDIFDVMQMCDTVISMNFSTVVLDAMILKKPTMTILPEKQDYEQDIIMKSGATIIVNKLDELESKLNDILNNEELRQKLVEDGQKIVNKYFVNHGKASVALVKLVSSLL